MTTLREVLAMPVAYVGESIEPMFNCSDEWPELSGILSHNTHGIKSPRVEVRVHGESWGDTRRYWRLMSVWFDGEPVAVAQHAGREGDDAVNRWFLDVPKYRQLAQHIRGLVPCHPEDIKQSSPDDDIGQATHWYGEHVVPGKVVNDLGWSR